MVALHKSRSLKRSWKMNQPVFAWTTATNGSRLFLRNSLKTWAILESFSSQTTQFCSLMIPNIWEVSITAQKKESCRSCVEGSKLKGTSLRRKQELGGIEILVLVIGQFHLCLTELSNFLICRLSINTYLNSLSESSISNESFIEDSAIINATQIWTLIRHRAKLVS